MDLTAKRKGTDCAIVKYGLLLRGLDSPHLAMQTVIQSRLDVVHILTRLKVTFSFYRPT